MGEQMSKYARAMSAPGGEQCKHATTVSGGERMSKYARAAGQSATREYTGAEHARKSMRRAVEKANEYRAEIERLRAQVERQRVWLDDPANPTDTLWWQRKDIHDDRWQSLEQTIGNLTGWVAIHLAEAGRYTAEQRQAASQWVRMLYEVERWIEAERLDQCVQYPNWDDDIPF